MHGEPAAHILILGGTSEANALVARLQGGLSNARIVLSLAGRTQDPDLPEGVNVRSGGFGGVDGLAAYLQDEKIAALLDATHPFARQIAENAVNAAALVGIPHAKLLRPPWQPKAGETWLMVASESEAAAALPAGARPFIALGRQHLRPFAGRSDIAPVLRMIELPEKPLGIAAEIVRGRPEPSVSAEAELFVERRISHLVCRNSGGARSYAKIEAAAALGIPVVMIARPPLSGIPSVVESVDAAANWVSGKLAQAIGGSR